MKPAFLSLTSLLLLPMLAGCGPAEENPSASRLPGVLTKDGFVVNYYSGVYEGEDYPRWVTLTNEKGALPGQGPSKYNPRITNAGYVIEDYKGDNPSIIIPETLDVDGVIAPIIGIAKYAFYNRSFVKEVTLNDSIVFLGDDCFYGSGVERFNVGGGKLKYIGENALLDTKMELASKDNIAYLPAYHSDYGFAYETIGELPKEITIPEGCYGFRDNLFADKEVTVNLPSSIRNLGINNFGSEGKAKARTQATSLRMCNDIPDYAFDMAPSLENLYFDPSTSSIGAHSFENTPTLKVVYIPSSVLKIGRNAFGGTETFRTVQTTFLCETTSKPEKWDEAWAFYSTNVGWGAQSSNINTNDDGFTYFKSGGGVSLLSYSGKAKELTIPSSIENTPVTGINSYCFYRNKTLTKVIIPDSITSIGDGAFMEAVALKEITLPNHQTSLADYLFAGCEKLEKINHESPITELGMSSLFASSSLDLGNILDSVVSYGEFALSGTSLTSWKMPEKMEELPTGLLYNCKNLTSVTLNRGVKSIGSTAFAATPIKALTLPNSVNSIGEAAFQECKELTSLVLPQIEAIPSNMCAGCGKLASIAIPGRVKSIGDQAFKGCSSLRIATISTLVTHIGKRAFMECTSLISVEFLTNNGTLTLADEVFLGCSALKAYKIPQATFEVRKDVFKDTGIPNGEYFSNMKVIRDGVTGYKDSYGYYVVLYSNKAEVIGYSKTFVADEMEVPGTFFGGETIKRIKGSLIIDEKTGQMTPSPIFPDSVEIYNPTEGSHYSGVKTLRIGEGVEEIGENAFSNCLALTKVYLPSSIKSIGNNAFPDSAEIIRAS